MQDDDISDGADGSGIAPACRQAGCTLERLIFYGGNQRFPRSSG